MICLLGVVIKLCILVSCEKFEMLLWVFEFIIIMIGFFGFCVLIRCFLSVFLVLCYVVVIVI